MASSDVTKISKANNYFAIKLQKLLANEQGNVFFSPFGISTALAMLYCGTKNETLQEMKQVLCYDDAGVQEQEIPACFGQFLSTFQAEPDCYTLDYANSLLTQKDIMVKGEYKAVLETFFHSLLLEVDFQKESEKVVSQINEWVNEKTHGMISQLLNSLDPSTVLVLLNTVYFKGTWVNTFPEKATRKSDFYNNGSKTNAKQVDMMYNKGNFRFVEKPTFKALEMPYKGNDIAMIVMLPAAIDGLPEIETMLSPAFLENLRQEMFKVKVNVTFPKFRLEYKKSLVPHLKKLGMNRAFTSKAQFGGISDSDQLAVSDVLHKAVLVVNEEGSEAAAATAVMMVKRCLRPELCFSVDRPFLFIIHHVKTGAILFMGRVEEM